MSNYAPLPSPFTLSAEKYLEYELLYKKAKDNHIKNSKCACPASFEQIVNTWIGEDREKRYYKTEWTIKRNTRALVVIIHSKYGPREKSFFNVESTYIDPELDRLPPFEIPDSAEFYKWAHRVMSDITCCEIQEQQHIDMNTPK